MALFFHPWMKTCFLPIFLALSPSIVSSTDHHTHDPDLFHFKTVRASLSGIGTAEYLSQLQRPELKSPRWDLTVHDESKLTPGYWFVGIKPSLDKTIGTQQYWFGPHIYDNDGELVWSGSPQLDTSNVMDFRISKIKGKDHLTVLDRDRKSGLIINDNYEVVDSFLTDYDHDNVNGHELHFMGDGTSVLVIRNNHDFAPDDEARSIGWERTDKQCEANYNGMRELDGKDNWKPSFDWNALGHIALNESTETDGNAGSKCTGPYDFIHTNSLDKTEDGDYLLSGRHTSTIYKISHKDGSIVWRLGGKRSDFDMGDIKFSRQHDIRYRGENETHMHLSFLDNAKGQDSKDPTHDYSRGLLLDLDLKHKTVTLVQEYGHPYKDEDNWHYANRRGNMQVLPNGNVFMGWSEQALQSEHTADGTKIMEAVFKADWVGAYRNYKFAFTGKPLTRPAVYAVSYNENEEHEHLPTTEVAVSWNGDTEVRSWKLFARVENDGKEHLMETLPRTGFETSHSHKGLWKTVRLEGLDSKNNTITDTMEIRVEQHPSIPPDEGYFDSAEGMSANQYPEHPFFGNPSATIAFMTLFLFGLVLSAVAVVLGWMGFLPLRWLRERSGWPQDRSGARVDKGRYRKVLADEEFDGDDKLFTSGKLRLNSPLQSRPP